MGEIGRQWLNREQKLSILRSIEQAKQKGIARTRSCRMWEISRRRVNRWAKTCEEGRDLNNGKPGPIQPCHKLLEEEREAVLAVAKEESYMDLSHRILTVRAWDAGLFFVSFSSVYRIMRADGLTGMRGVTGPHNGRSLAPERREITGPNQRWCWDISYLSTYEKGLFLYLYLVLDEFSRKAVSWLISWHQRTEEAIELIEAALLAENILDLPEDQRPEIVNDRGAQMKAKPITKMFELHHMPQRFARPRTPNDNPFVESAFGTAKCAPAYPGQFLDRQDGIRYFEGYFGWYNFEHLHSGIEYVTPDQCHRGLKDEIVAGRKKKLEAQRQLRRQMNRAGMNSVRRDIPRLPPYQPWSL